MDGSAHVILYFVWSTCHDFKPEPRPLYVQHVCRVVGRIGTLGKPAPLRAHIRRCDILVYWQAVSRCSEPCCVGNQTAAMVPVFGIIYETIYMVHHVASCMSPNLVTAVLGTFWLCTNTPCTALPCPVCMGRPPPARLCPHF